jgi:hypothetical protein
VWMYSSFVKLYSYICFFYGIVKTFRGQRILQGNFVRASASFVLFVINRHWSTKEFAFCVCAYASFALFIIGNFGVWGSLKTKFEFACFIYLFVCEEVLCVYVYLFRCKL